MSARCYTVALVEDDDATRESLVRKIEEAGADLRVTAAVGTCRGILQALEELRPDVLLVDLGLPDGDGLDVIRQSRAPLASAPISPGIARHLIRQFRQPSEPHAQGAVIKLSPRELDVLTLASKGYSYAETASLLGLTQSTVGSYTKTIYEKLAVGSRSEVVYEATRLGLINDAAP